MRHRAHRRPARPPAKWRPGSGGPRPRPGPATAVEPAQCAPAAPAAAADAAVNSRSRSKQPAGQSAFRQRARYQLHRAPISSRFSIASGLSSTILASIPYPALLRAPSSFASDSQISRVTRTANCVSTTSNSLHASCTSPEASGTSSPWPHCDLDQLAQARDRADCARENPAPESLRRVRPEAAPSAG